jgi:hypothetical protein
VAVISLVQWQRGHHTGLSWRSTVAAQNEVPGFLPSRNGWPFTNNLSGTYPAVTLPVIGFFAARYAFRDPAGSGAAVVTVDSAPSGS